MQAAAQQILGDKQVQFPKCYQQGPCAGKWDHLYDGTFKQKWHPSHGENQWWIDALSIDPASLCDDLKGIWEHGTPQPVLQTSIQNANVGQLPLVLVYIAVHQDYGTHIFFPFHGAKHGGVDKQSQNTMYGGFRFWYHNVGAEALQRLAHMKYFNSDSAMQKHEQLQLQQSNKSNSNSNKAKRQQVKAKRQLQASQQASQSNMAGTSSQSAVQSQAGPSTSAQPAATQEGEVLEAPWAEFNPWSFLVCIVTCCGVHALFCKLCKLCKAQSRLVHMQSTWFDSTLTEACMPLLATSYLPLALFRSSMILFIPSAHLT